MILMWINKQTKYLNILEEQEDVATKKSTNANIESRDVKGEFFPLKAKLYNIHFN